MTRSIPSTLSPAAVPVERDPACAPRRARKVSPRLVGTLCIPIGLLLLPFADHRSRDPVWLSFSRDYLLFLAALGITGLTGAFALAWAVRNAPPHRRLPFALILLAVPITVLVVLEAYVGLREHDVFSRFHKWGNIKSPFMGFEAAPNHRWEVRGVVYTTDANRFRTHVTPRVAPEDETLIVVMGGSSVFGYGLNDDETWPHRLEQELRDRFGPGITVLNAGNNCLTTLQQLFRFYLRVLPLKPDYVIHYGLMNDTRTAEDIAQSLIWLPETAFAAYSMRDYVRKKNAGKGFYFENSVLFDRLKLILENIAVPAASQDPLLEPVARDKRRHELNEPETAARIYGPGATWYVRNLDSLRILCENNGIQFALVTFIAENHKFPLTREVGFDYLRRALREHCERQGVRRIDLYPAFEHVENKADLFFEDHYHPSREGAEFIAAHVADALTPVLAQDLKRDGARVGRADR